jgi:hypothetical protein
MSTRHGNPYPEVYCDFNARMTESGYDLNRSGSIEDFRKLGLDLKSAVGKRITFFMDDADEQGRPDDIMFNGVVIYDEIYGYLAQEDEDVVYWRSQIVDP